MNEGLTPERHECRNLRAGREPVHGAAGQAGHDVHVADGEGEVGVNNFQFQVRTYHLERRGKRS